jgi:hypothetical protein
MERSKFNFKRPHPKIIVATQNDAHDWIDPYAAKRRKNARYNARKEQRRLERLERLDRLEEESESSDEQTVGEPETSVWN